MRRPPSALLSASHSYFEEMHARFRQNPEAVDASWRAVFLLVDDLLTGEAPHRATADENFAASLRQGGHLRAATNPLESVQAPQDGQKGEGPGHLRDVWLGPLTAETGHIDDDNVRDWLVRRLEATEETLSPEARRGALFQLLQAEGFEQFLRLKAPTKKRFGLEGGEAVLPLLRRMMEQAVRSGVEEFIIASMHRGRLNLMVNVLEEAARDCFHAFIGEHPFPHRPDLLADVPYHLGCEIEREIAGRPVRISLCTNPSHLEAVNPVGLGRARARQDLARRNGADPARALCILLHTDASVIGQGSVAETIQLGRLRAFGTAGTIHIVINNQIGFTTDPADARSSHHCTGAWKAVDSAILHVNGNDPDAALRAADIAVDFRQAHARDAVIDFVCYRRNGHNELDEPTFTQPKLYEAIAALPPVADLYVRRLCEAALTSESEVAEARESYHARLQQDYERAKAGGRNDIIGEGNGTDVLLHARARPETGLAPDLMQELLSGMVDAPEGFCANDKVMRILRQQAQGENLLWPVAEALAFASLLREGVDVRLTGQDVERGAFSTRHFVLHDKQTGKSFNRLQPLATAPARFEIVNSPLSENAVLGFEYGYSLERPDAMVIWEAQFGDFLNCAQVIFDQFIVSGEEKWAAASGLVVLLPHGLEGQGPEHSSARIERILQLCAGDNIGVANPSTPANYFHLLRRQARQMPRRPLVILSPKTLLRLQQAASPLADFATENGFQPVLADSIADPSRVRRVLLCSGKLGYALAEERKRLGDESTAILRLEQYFPFPEEALCEALAPFSEAELVWIQEEPVNMGCWTWLDRRLEAVLRSISAARSRPWVIARPEAASPGGSFHSHHEEDQKALLERAFGPSPQSFEECYHPPQQTRSVAGRIGR